MADEDTDLVSEIKIEGAEESAKAIEDYAEKGSEAFDKLGESAKKAGDDVEKGTDQIDKSVSKSSDNVEKIIRRAADALKSVGDAQKETSQQSRKTAAALGQIEAASRKMGQEIGKNAQVLASFVQRVAALGAGAAAAGVGLLRLAQNVAKASQGTKSGLDEQTKAQIAANNASLQGELRANNYASSQRRLLDQLRDGSMDYESYSKAAYALRQEYEEQIRVSARVEAAQEEVAKQNEKLQQQAADRAAYQKLVDTYGGELTGSLIALGRTVQSVSNTFRDSLGPAASEVVDLINRVIQQNLPAIQQFAQRAGQQIQQFVQQNGPAIEQAFSSIAQGAGMVFTSIIENAPTLLNLFNNQIVPAVQAAYGAIKSVVDGINSIFGTSLTPGMLAIAAILLRLTGGFQLLFATVRTGAAVFSVLNLALAATNSGGVTFLQFLRMVPVLLGPWGLTLAALAAGLTALYLAVDWKKFGQDVQTFVTNFSDWFAALPEKIGGYIQGMVDSVNSTIQGWIDYLVSLLGRIVDWFAALPGRVADIFASVGRAIVEAFTNAFNSVTSTIQGWVDTIKSYLQPIIDMINFIASNGGGGGGGEGSNFAGGGSVRGPGTSTSDSIPAWLSNNEFVVRAKAVRKYGVGFMRAINSGRLDFSGAVRLATGGLVNVGGPSFSYTGGGDGGGSSGMRPLTLNIGGQEFGGLLAPADVANQMVSFAIQRRIRSAGRKPSWVG